MRLIVTADLHYNIVRSMAPTRRLAAEVCKEAADALIIVGDTCGKDVSILGECLRLFDGFRGRRMLVAGNHDLWTDGADSLVRYERELLEVCRECGVHYLDDGPLVLEGVGFVGSVGWYDYTYRSAKLGVPLRFYQAKMGPGAAANLPDFWHLVMDHEDVSREALGIATQWMDGQFVHLPFSDLDFTRILVEKLERHLGEVSERCDQIVAAIHHIPFAEILDPKKSPMWQFGNAFMGSELFGDLLLEWPKVRHVFCGHSHQVRRMQVRHISVTNVGCTYIRKRYEVVDIGSRS
jgi:predicted phosphohydrolase